MELPVDTAFDKYGDGLGKQLEGEIKLPQERPECHAQKYDGRIGEDVGQEDDQQASFRADLKEGGKGKLDQLREVQRTAAIEIHYIRQREMRGLGDAILCAKHFVGDEPFAVLLGDDVVYHPERPALRQLIDVYEATHGGSVLGCQTVPEERVSSYGIVAGTPVEPESLASGGQAAQALDTSRCLRVTDMVEKPALEEAPSRMAVLGRYIIASEIFDILEQTQPGKGGEIQLTDALKILAKQQAMYAYDFEGMRYDLGDKLGFLKATVEFALRREDL